MGFDTEILPSGRINLLNKLPFVINGMKTITQFKGSYTFTTEAKSIPDLLTYIRTLELL